MDQLRHNEQVAAWTVDHLLRDLEVNEETKMALDNIALRDLLEARSVILKEMEDKIKEMERTIEIQRCTIAFLEGGVIDLTNE